MRLSRAASSIGPVRRRRFALIFATLIGAPLGLALIAMAVVVVVALSGISVDASRWRDAAAQRGRTGAHP